MTEGTEQPGAAERRVEWANRTLTQGEILRDFAVHCRDELDEVELVEEERTHLVARWRRETSRIELRQRIDGLGRVDPTTPTMLVGELGDDLDALAEAFVSDQNLRNTLALYDLVRLEKVSAVRSSVFVYFEWFLRDAYGVKLLPAAAFTQRLIERGVISLGFG